MCFTAAQRAVAYLFLSMKDSLDFNEFIETLMERRTWGEQWPPVDLYALSRHMSNTALGPVQLRIVGNGQFTSVLKVTGIDYVVAVKYINDSCTEDDIQFATNEFITEARILTCIEGGCDEAMKRHIGQYFHSAMLAPLQPVLFLDSYDNYYELSTLIDGKFHLNFGPDWLLCMRQVLFHVVITLAQLQRDFPHFRHNDLKDNNILFCLLSEREQEEMVYSFEGVKYLLHPIVVDTKIIDFATAHSEHEQLSNPQVRAGSYHAYDITDAACPMYDLHFLILCFYMRIKRAPATPEVIEVLQFFHDIIPYKFFDVKYVNKVTRLTLEGQKELTEDSTLQFKTPGQVLMHSFFSPFVALECASADTDMDLTMMLSDML